MLSYKLYVCSLFTVTPYMQGAATSVYAAVWPGLEQHSGAYLADCAVATPAAAASDMSMAAKLWDETAEQLSRV